MDPALNTAGANVRDDAEWYVQKGSRVLGPFSPTEVGRFLLLGRVRSTDRVSRDGELWEPVTQVPELVPEELLDLENDTGWTRFLDARVAGDERRAESSVATERRTGEDIATSLREEWRPRERTARPQSALPWVLLAVTLIALSVVLWLNRTGGPF